MRWTVTIKDPLNELPDFTLSTFGEDGYQRSLIQSTDAPAFTATGAAVITGTLSKYRFTWTFSVALNEADALILEAMAMIQDYRYSSGGDGRLILVDEFEYCPPQNPPHSKQLLEPIATSYGMVYGFGQFEVMLRLPEQHKTHQGKAGNSYLKLVQFSAIELPS